MSSIKVRPMSASEMDVACQVIGLAFADNPSTLATVRGDRAKSRSTMERAMHVVKLGGSDNPPRSVQTPASAPLLCR